MESRNDRKLYGMLFSWKHMEIRAIEGFAIISVNKNSVTLG